MARAGTPQASFAEERDSVLTFVKRVASIDRITLTYAGWPAFEGREPTEEEERVLRISSPKSTVELAYMRAGWYSDTGRYAIENRIIEAFGKL